MTPNILSIAGSDPSGGAGIQADIKSISANGGYAMTAICALTAQNTQGVSGVHLLPAQFVKDQLVAVFEDIKVDAIKIGMLANVEIALAVASALEGHENTPVVLDPVMIAKGGASLLAPETVAVLRDTLLPRATLITPNLPEAAALLNRPVAQNRDEITQQGRTLSEHAQAAVLMKGGHLSGEQSPDCLVIPDENEVYWFEGTRLHTKNTHGTGCTLSSALATQIGHGLDIQSAVAKAKAYVAQAIAHADLLDVGSGHGPTNHFWRLQK